MAIACLPRPTLETLIPKITGHLRELVSDLADDLTPLVHRATQTVFQTEPEYSKLQDSIKRDVLESVDFSIRVWVNTVLSGEPPTGEDLHVIGEAARRRVHQGISLSSLLRAFRIGPKEVWRTFLELGEQNADISQQLLFQLSPYLLDHFDRMAQTVATAYLDEQYQRNRWRDALRYELLNVVFRFPEDTASFRKAAEGLGLDPTVPRVALAMEVLLPDVLPSRVESEHDRILLAISHALKIPFDELIRTLHRDLFLVWLPLHHGASLLAADKSTAQAAQQIIKSVREVKAIGIGLVNQGAPGWAMSMDEAMKAIDSGRHDPILAKNGVFRYSDVAINESVLRTDNVLRYIESMIERLAHEPDLLKTLASYFEHGQHRRETSEALGIHANTLNYRLTRIEEILGADLNDINWLARLNVAMRLRFGTSTSSTGKAPNC